MRGQWTVEMGGSRRQCCALADEGTRRAAWASHQHRTQVAETSSSSRRPPDAFTSLRPILLVARLQLSLSHQAGHAWPVPHSPLRPCLAAFAPRMSIPWGRRRPVRRIFRWLEGRRGLSWDHRRYFLAQRPARALHPLLLTSLVHVSLLLQGRTLRRGPPLGWASQATAHASAS
jgi:hypothetical protein